MKTWHPGTYATIDLMVDEPVDEHVTLVDLADSDDENTPIAAPTVVVKKGAMNVHLNNTDIEEQV